jgi:dimethylargininase
MFKNAIVRIPGENFSEGLTTVGQGTLGPPDYAKALAQHEAYCKALETCGLRLTVLGKDLDHPDSTFV